MYLYTCCRTTMAVETVDLRGCLLDTECRHDGAEAGAALSKFQAWLNTTDRSCVHVDALLDRLVPMRCGSGRRTPAFLAPPLRFPSTLVPLPLSCHRSLDVAVRTTFVRDLQPVLPKDSIGALYRALDVEGVASTDVRDPYDFGKGGVRVFLPVCLPTHCV
jgi:hypothetical protein